MIRLISVICLIVLSGCNAKQPETEKHYFVPHHDPIQQEDGEIIA